MAAADPNLYRWKFNYRARQFFNAVNPEHAALTNAQVDAYVRQLDLVGTDIVRGSRIDSVNQRINDLRTGLTVSQRVRDFPRVPDAVGTDANLNDVYPTANMPTDAQIAASRGRIAAGIAAVPGGPAAPARSRGRPTIASPEGADVGPFELIDNIKLADNPPTIYDAIREADIRRINAEIKDPSFDPEQLFEVTITPPGGDNVITQLTPIQYAALAGLKGIVRLLLRSKVDINKKIVTKPDEKLTIIEAIDRFRKNDTDKSAVKFVFTIADTASKDASDDYSSGVKLDSEYGKGLEKEVDKALAKLIYEREYKELENPTLPKVPKKTTTGLVEEARKRGKEDAERGLERSSEYLAKPELEKKAYQDEYTKYIVEKDKKKGKADGEAGSSPDPVYATKTPEEKEAYGKEYDKARAAYQGERDASMNEPSDFPKLEKELSEYYTKTAPEFYKSSIKKIYNDTYEKNRSKTADLVKEAGYVGTYPPSDAVLSGNYFGFGSELSRIVGFDTTGTALKTDTDAQYKEGLAKFVKEFDSLIGQAKYAGYTDGRKKNAKYTTPGKITVDGKDYAVDFGKLNTRVTELPMSATGVPEETAEYGQVKSILKELGDERDKVGSSINSMVALLKTKVGDAKTLPKIRKILKQIIVSQSVSPEAPAAPAVAGGGQRGGFTEDERTNVNESINNLKIDEDTKEGLQQLLKELEINDDDGLKTIKEKVNKIISNPAGPAAPADAVVEPPKADSKKEDEMKLKEMSDLIAKSKIKEKIVSTLERLSGDKVPYKERLLNPSEDLNKLLEDVSGVLNTQKESLKTKIEKLPSGKRRSNFTSNLEDPRFTLEYINFYIDKAIKATSRIEEVDEPDRTKFLDRFNTIGVNLDELKNDIEKAILDQTETIQDQKKLVSAGLSKLDTGLIKTRFEDELKKPDVTIAELKTLYANILVELRKKEITTDLIKKLPADGAVKKDFTDKVASAKTLDNLNNIEIDIKNWIDLQERLKSLSWYISDKEKDKKVDFKNRLNNKDITYADLEKLKSEMDPLLPYAAIRFFMSIGKVIPSKDINKEKEKIKLELVKLPNKDDGTPGATKAEFQTRLDSEKVTIDELKVLYKEIQEWLKLKETILKNTEKLTEEDKKRFVDRVKNPDITFEELKLIDDEINVDLEQKSKTTGIYKLLGAVTTKSQLYSVVQQALSSIPKYETVTLKRIPTGISPDDPSLGADVHPIKRLQVMYDKEFQRGYKEATRPIGGTRRKSKKTNRTTRKKQVSKK